MSAIEKLLQIITASTKHEVTELTIDSIIDDAVQSSQFPYKNFKHFIKEDLIDEIEEEQSLMKSLEFFKNSLLINFANSSEGKDIPNISTNYGNILSYFSGR